jgi:type IV/VI secretion system ImpK/VasF family protein
MEPADIRTTSEFETIELEPPAEALPDEPATIEFETTEIAPDDLADRNEVVTGEFAAVEEAVTGEFAAVEEAVTGEFSTVMATEEEIDSPHADRSFVLKKFHSFYQEIIRFRHQKSTLAGGMATAVGDAAGVHASADPSNPARAAKEQSSKWRELLQLYAAEAKWLGGDKSGRYPDAQYVMVALADEVLATTDWLGRAAWEQHRLEPAFYQSSDAGAKVFRDIDELLRAQGTPANRDLALVYLMTLAAGFRGIYGDPGDDAKLAEYRRRLYHFAHRRDPRLAESRTLFPSTVAYTVEGRAVPRVSMVQRWLIVLAAALVAYLVIAHMVWTGAVADLTDVLGRIHDML